MAQIIREIRVDVSQPNVFQAIVAKQLDCNSRFLKIALVDFGVKIEVPKTAKVTINANRPDGKSDSFMGVANNDGTITVPLAQWMLEVAGLLKCDVSVINTTDNKRLTSTDFYVNVQEAANKSTDISENPDGEIRVITPTQTIDKNSTDDQYPSAKAVYDLDNVTATATGNAITIDSSEAPLQNLKLFGKTTQSGTPTPSAPVPFVSIGDNGSFEVGIYEKNLLNIPTTTLSNGYLFNRLSIFLRKGVAYTFSLMSDVSGDTQFKGFDAQGQTIVDVGFKIKIGVNYCSFTPTEDVSSVSFYANISNVTLSEIQLEIGSVATKFEKCQKQTLKSNVLRGFDGVADEKNFASEKTIQRFYSRTFNGSENWELRNDEVVALSLNDFPANASAGLYVKGRILSNIAEAVAWAELPNTDNGVAIGSVSSKFIGFKVQGHTESISAWKSFLASNNVSIVYELATPIESDISETELNAYRQLYTNKGTTNILNNDGADMSVTYYISKPNAQAIGNLHTQINKDYFKLQQAIISTGGNV
jgi:hypothetical protein